jgi:hypothetical protein
MTLWNTDTTFHVEINIHAGCSVLSYDEIMEELAISDKYCRHCVYISSKLADRTCNIIHKVRLKVFIFSFPIYFLHEAINLFDFTS